MTNITRTDGELKPDLSPWVRYILKDFEKSEWCLGVCALCHLSLHPWGCVLLLQFFYILSILQSKNGNIHRQFGGNLTDILLAKNRFQPALNESSSWGVDGDCVRHSCRLLGVCQVSLMIKRMKKVAKKIIIADLDGIWAQRCVRQQVSFSPFLG